MKGTGKSDRTLKSSAGTERRMEAIMKSLKLRDNFYWTGIVDKDLRVFDIIMYTEFGTTYNSYVMKAGDKTILFETAKEKFLMIIWKNWKRSPR